MQHTLVSPQMTREARLRDVFALIDEARREGCYRLADKARAYLLSEALSDIRGAQSREIWIELATTDRYGDAAGESDEDRIFILYKDCKTHLRATLLNRDTTRRVYKRVDTFAQWRSGAMETRQRTFPSPETSRALEERWKDLVPESSAREAAALLG